VRSCSFASATGGERRVLRNRVRGSDPAFDYLRENYGLLVTDKRVVSVPALIALTALILAKGADRGMKMLYVVPGSRARRTKWCCSSSPGERKRELADIVDNYQLVASLDFDVCILGSSERGFGYKRTLHVWLSPSDEENANLMILLAYIVLGHPDWKDGLIKIFSIMPEEEMEQERQRLGRPIKAGRLAISIINIELVPQGKGLERRAIIAERSRDADLVVVGFRPEALRRMKSELFTGPEGIGDVLFVNASREIDLLTQDDAAGDAEPEDSKSPLNTES
jgi:nucleotide-binding universal stress UspA family protein